MKIITAHDVAHKHTGELYGLLQHCFTAMASHQPHTQEHINALASLETIQRELALRLLAP